MKGNISDTDRQEIVDGLYKMSEYFLDLGRNMATGFDHVVPSLAIELAKKFSRTHEL